MTDLIAEHYLSEVKWRVIHKYPTIDRIIVNETLTPKHYLVVFKLKGENNLRITEFKLEDPVITEVADYNRVEGCINNE